MSIAFLKTHLLLPEREILLGKPLSLQDKAALLVSVTEQAGVIKLWMLQEGPDIPETDTDFLPSRTNREDIHRRTQRCNVGNLHFTEIALQGIPLPIRQSASGLVDRDPLAHMKLQHFIEAGVDLSFVENIGLGHLYLCEYQLAEGSLFPSIDPTTDMPLSLTTRDEVTEHLLEPTQRLRLTVGKQADNMALSFYDPICHKDIPYYINEVLRYDIRGEMERRMQDEETVKMWRRHGLDEEAIRRMRAQLPESIDRLCPEGQEQLLIQYEVEGGLQLNFYTPKFLDSEPARNESSSVGIIGMHNPGESLHGLPVRTALLTTMPAGFDGMVEAELVSFHRTAPGNRIEA